MFFVGAGITRNRCCKNQGSFQLRIEYPSVIKYTNTFWPAIANNIKSVFRYRVQDRADHSIYSEINHFLLPQPCPYTVFVREDVSIINA